MKNQTVVVLRYQDRVLIPTMARTTQGYSLAVAPVAVHAITDEDAVVRSIITAITLTTPTVPTPSRDAWPKTVYLAPAGVKSDAAFEKSGASWTLGCDGAQWHVYPSKRNAKGRWEVDMAKAESHSMQSSPEQLARHLLDLVKDASPPWPP